MSHYNGCLEVSRHPTVFPAIDWPPYTQEVEISQLALGMGVSYNRSAMGMLEIFGMYGIPGSIVNNEGMCVCVCVCVSEIEDLDEITAKNAHGKMRKMSMNHGILRVFPFIFC